MTVLLSRNRPPPTTVAAGVPHANFAAELISLPSGLLAMVCEAIMTLKVRLRQRCWHARLWGWSDSMQSAGSTTYSTVLDTLQVSDVVRVKLRRSSRLSTLRAGCDTAWRCGASVRRTSSGVKLRKLD